MITAKGWSITNSNAPVSRRARVLGLFVVFGLVLMTSSFSLAEEGSNSNAAPASAGSTEKVKTGVLANTGSFIQGSGAVDVHTSGASPGDEAGVITANVSRGERGKCVAVVKNTSKKNSYSVRFRVLGRDSRGTTSIKKTYSATLSPGSSTTKSVRCNEDHQMSVNLLSASIK